MKTRTRLIIAAASVLVVAAGPGARPCGAQQPQGPGVIGSYFPTQLVRGETNVLHAALVRNNPVLTLEITPAQGITVTNTTARDLNQGSVWWEFTIDVAKETAPVTLTIPDHAPQVSNLKVLSAKTAQETIDLQFTAADQGGTFGKTPYVW